MKKLAKDESGFAIVEAVIVFPVILLITIAFFLLTIFLYERINLQKSLDWYVDRLSASIGISYGEMISDSSSTDYVNNVTVEIIEDAKFPYRYFTTQKGVIASFENAILDYSNIKSAYNAYDYKIDIKVKNYVIYQEVTASASKEFKLPINFSMVGINSNPTLCAVSKRMTHDPDEFMRNVDLVFDVSNYINDKYQITDKIGTMFEKVGKLFKK